MSNNNYKNITAEEVMEYAKPTNSFLCPLSANTSTYNIEFVAFKIIDYNTKKVIFDVARDVPPPDMSTIDFTNESSYRHIKYTLSEDVLRLPNVETMLVFKVGDREVRNFRMVERYYFKNELIRSYDFTFGFVIPGSTNTWQANYSLPYMDDQLVNDIIDNPYGMESDTFYFAGDKLIMHNKASYKYIREQAEGKRSYDRDDYKAGSKSGLSAKADSKGAKGESGDGSKSGGGAKAMAKWEEEENWSKESDYL